MKFFVSLFAATLFLVSGIFAQGFNSFNNRNHPYLNWKVAETEHFRIIYPERIADIIPLAAAISEASYDALSLNLNVEFEKKIPIYLSDEDEIINGFANPIGKGYTMIWVNLNDYADNWTGSVKWLRKVIAHELGHIFHFKAIWSNMALWQYTFAEPLPRFWTEGLAQYQTELWDSQRGDRWLRKAIFDSRPGYNDGQSAENGRLMYAAGNSQLRYFTETYGDSSLANFLAQREKILGIFEYHDFYEGFRQITGESYSSFYEHWRKHMNIYYNTLASQMERTDSLNADRLSLPGQVYYDIAVSPDDSLLAVLSLPSLQRPVRRLFIVSNDSTRSSRIVAEGDINPDLSWSHDGKTLFYSRTNRGEHSSLVNDLYSLDVNSGKESRITHSRRARYPVQGPDENTVGYIVNTQGTGNLFIRNVETGIEEQVTRYIGDIQLIDPVWIPGRERWLYHRFGADGSRHMVLLNPVTGEKKLLDSADMDNRKFVLNSDGSQIAYTSLRDQVPNVFIYDLESDTERRLTRLFTGGEVYGWSAPTDSLSDGRILIEASETKRRDHVWWIDAGRTTIEREPKVPGEYATWRYKQAPHWIPFSIEPDESLILGRYRYRSFKNITHAASIALPYYADSNNWGLFGTTGWVEPLAKHMIAGTGILSFGNIDQSFGVLSYINNQLYPTITTSIYKIPGSGFFYGDRFLVEELTGAEIALNLPLDALESSYQTGSLFARMRHVLVKPYDQDRFTGTFLLPQPRRANQTDVTIGMIVKKQRPWRNNLIHPLDGWGLRAMITGAEEILGSDVRFATADISTYTVLPGPGLQRFYLHARFQQQWGTPLPQDFIGFSRIDNINLNLPGEMPLDLFSEAERVRGYRSFIAGDRVLFSTLEYRLPVTPSLDTSILGGIFELGSTSLSLFTDAGVVWNARLADGTIATEKRWGAGAELKNRINLFGILFAHAIGIAQPAEQLFTDADTDLYYRVRAVVPF